MGDRGPAGRKERGRSQRVLRKRWRSRAWKRAGQGKWHEALVLQRALVAAAPARPSREDLGDRFRLLRWEMAAGCWREALECVDGLYGRLSARGLLEGPVAGWVFLARAVAYLQMGAGPRFRKSLALVLHGRGRRRSARLYSSALRVGAAGSRLSREPGAPAGVLERRWHRLFGSGSAGDDSAEPVLAEALGRSIPHSGDRGVFRWDHLPALLEGPPAAVHLGEQLDRTDCFRAEAGCPADGAAGVPAQPGESAPGDLLLRKWLLLADGDRGAAVPVWAVPLLARLAEQAAPEAEPGARARMHQALSRLAAQVSEPWARALALEALAEVSLWMSSGTAGDARSLRAAEAGLGQARADLGLAAGLFNRMGWKQRARICESRWMRLAFPAAGPRVAEPARPASWSAARATESCRGPRPAGPGVLPAVPGPAWCAAASRRKGDRTLNLSWVRQTLGDAGFLTGDPRVLRDLAPLLLLAPTPLPVLILGESGTGKEVIARALHRWSQARGEFVPIHCGAIPKDLLESELFGHTRGAFTGANVEKAGLVEAADSGSLFLDEIGEMGMEAQMKMLRVLESGEVRRLGDLRARRVRIRLVAATHRNLDEAVHQGIFRLDLYHRVRGIVVRLRPLRERRGDIPLLAARFLAEAGEHGAGASASLLHLPDASLAALLAHEWPGNVRELRSLLLRSAHLARALGLDSLNPELLGLPLPPREGAEWSLLPEAGALDRRGGEDLAPKEVLARGGLEAVLDGMERRLILHALEESGWNRTRAARSLGGLSRTTLISKMKRLGIAAEEPEEPAGRA